MEGGGACDLRSRRAEGGRDADAGEEAEAQTAEVGPSPGTPVATDDGRRRGGDDLTDDEDQIDHSATPVLESDDDDDMSIEEQPVPAAAPTTRQREPAVDEDDLPLDDAEDSASKRRRLGQLCTRSLLTEMTEILDKQAVKKLERDVRRTQRRNFGNARIDVAEIYSPPRMPLWQHSLAMSRASRWT